MTYFSLHPEAKMSRSVRISTRIVVHVQKSTSSQTYLRWIEFLTKCVPIIRIESDYLVIGESVLSLSLLPGRTVTSWSWTLRKLFDAIRINCKRTLRVKCLSAYYPRWGRCHSRICSILGSRQNDDLSHFKYNDLPNSFFIISSRWYLHTCSCIFKKRKVMIIDQDRKRSVSEVSSVQT